MASKAGTPRPAMRMMAIERMLRAAFTSRCHLRAHHSQVSTLCSLNVSMPLSRFVMFITERRPQDEQVLLVYPSGTWTTIRRHARWASANPRRRRATRLLGLPRQLSRLSCASPMQMSGQAAKSRRLGSLRHLHVKKKKRSIECLSCQPACSCSLTSSLLAQCLTPAHYASKKQKEKKKKRKKKKNKKKESMARFSGAAVARSCSRPYLGPSCWSVGRGPVVSLGLYFCPPWQRIATISWTARCRPWKLRNLSP